jgi:hypothetical protein
MVRVNSLRVPQRAAWGQLVDVSNVRSVAIVSDEQAAIRRQVLQRIAERRQSERVSLAPAWRVQRSDLQSLEHVRSLLTALNNPYVSTTRVEQLVEQIRVLRVRCIRRAFQASDSEQTPNLSEALGQIGNKGLEAELLVVLEDLTILSAEIQDEENQ